MHQAGLILSSPRDRTVKSRTVPLYDLVCKRDNSNYSKVYKPKNRFDLNLFFTDPVTNTFSARETVP
jgi:hypothetical protein